MLIILLHSVLPHAHHGQLSEAEHEATHSSADNLIDYIQLIFHMDMGDGHLEHFEAGHGIDFDFGVSLFSLPNSIFSTKPIFVLSDEPKFILPEYLLKDVPLPISLLGSTAQLRGPPIS